MICISPTKEHDLYQSYNVKDITTEGGVQGCYISHTSSPEKGYTIIDGKRCPCKTRFAYMSPCRPEIAKSKHKGQPLFRVEQFDRLDLFSPVLSRLQLCQDIANPETFMSGEVVVTQPSQSTGGRLKSSVSGHKHKLDSNLQHSSLSCSPSKLKTPPHLAVAQLSQSSIEPRKKKKRRSNQNVPYLSLKNRCKDLADVASRMDNCIQNAVYTHVKELKDMLEFGDFGSNEYVGNTVGALAQQLSSITSDTPRSTEKGYPRVSNTVPRPGADPTYRLGSKKSHRSRSGQTCGFCGDAIGGPDHPGNITRCRKKANYGMFIQLKAAAKKAEAVTRLQTIIDGKDQQFRHNFANDLSQSTTKRLSTPPSTGKRVQIKGYLDDGEVKYFLCTCINRGGNKLSQVEGTNTVSYEDVFIQAAAIMASIAQFDFIFFAPLAMSGDSVAMAGI